MRNPGARSPFLLIGDHAGCEVPAALEELGLPHAELTRHIGWDIGVAELGQRLADTLDACFIAQRFSRLVIDCNRDPGRPDAICEVSDGTRVPGNAGLSEAERQIRIDEVFAPYHRRIEDEVSARMARDQPTQLVALHSFTPVMDQAARPWRYGVLHLGASPFSDAVLASLRARLSPDLVGDNQPYRMDATDYTIPRQAVARGLDYVELEVRQDLIADPAGVQAAADLLAPALREALARLG
ncbi:N-formylglutamate amidohydrolase [Phenylobacterium sp. LjRoot225]|uniref:N-formylglutamate amidohydrolase n=1 Tax=Phenylobacterium sp. LjRoot225 TaxID=3342285 RepID=UPI003ED009F0